MESPTNGSGRNVNSTGQAHVNTVLQLRFTEPYINRWFIHSLDVAGHGMARNNGEWIESDNILWN